MFLAGWIIDDTDSQEDLGRPKNGLSYNSMLILVSDFSVEGDYIPSRSPLRRSCTDGPGVSYIILPGMNCDSLVTAIHGLADLTSLFNWNTKQLFVYLAAEYTNSQGVRDMHFLL